MNIILPINSSRILIFFLKNAGKILLLTLCLFTLTNCGSAYSSSYAPVAPLSVSTAKSLNRHSVSDAQRSVVKTGSLNIKTNNVREAGETVEEIIANSGGYITSMSERDDKSKYANFEMRIPAHSLVNTMDEIAKLGKVSYRKISVKDVTTEAIQQTATLNKLKTRRDRLKGLYKNAKTIADKLKIEELLSDIEQDIFSIEEAIKQMLKTSQYSKLSLTISQSKIRGPLGIVKDSTTWSLKKLFTIRE